MDHPGVDRAPGGFRFHSPSSTAFFQPTFLTPPEACELRPDLRPALPWVAGFFCLPVLAELLRRIPSLMGVAGFSFSFVASAGGGVLEVFLGRRIELGTAEVGLRPTTLLGGEPIPAFLEAPSSSTGVLERLRVFFVKRERIRS